MKLLNIWLTDQVNKALEIEDNINLTLIVEYYKNYKNEIFHRT